MKILMSSIIVIIFSSCMQNNNAYDEKNYLIVKIDTSENRVNSKILVNKFDTSRKMVLLYWDNGKIMSKGFFKGQLRDGINEHFYIYGNLQTSELYSNGVKLGSQKTYYPNGKIKYLEEYADGKLTLTQNFDTTGNKIK